jgi:hypothetical protein
MEAFLEVLTMVSAAVGCADLAIRKGAGLNSNGDGSKLLLPFFLGINIHQAAILGYLGFGLIAK